MQRPPVMKKPVCQWDWRKMSEADRKDRYVCLCWNDCHKLQKEKETAKYLVEEVGRPLKIVAERFLNWLYYSKPGIVIGWAWFTLLLIAIASHLYVGVTE